LEKLALVDPEDNEIRKRMDSFPHTIDRLKKQIDEALRSQRLLSAESGSALNLLEAAESKQSDTNALITSPRKGKCKLGLSRSPNKNARRRRPCSQFHRAGAEGFSTGS
jgi:hypothetical protein